MTKQSRRSWRQRYDPDAEMVFRRPTRVGDRLYQPGEDVPTKGVSARLRHRWWDNERIELKHFQSRPRKTLGAAPPPEPVTWRDEVVEAIGKLDPKDSGLWTAGKKRKPKVGALNALLDFEIDASERDEAWATYQERQGG